MSSSEPELDKFEIFENWLRAAGSKFPKLELQDYGNEVRGCHSKEAIQKDDVIVDIPLKCLITVEMGKETAIGKIIMASNIDLDAPKHIYLMMFILVDRLNPDSFFKPYYDILPATLRNMPIFWDERELSYLEGSYLISQVKERRIAIENDYKSICSIAPQFAKMCDLELFKWARMCVCSRNFGITVNGLRTAALVPYADMLNHLRPRQSKWQFEDASQSFTITAIDGISVGAQVYDSYGQKCNHRFLLNYGFSVESNIESDGYCPNEVPFRVELSPEDPLYEDKVQLLRREGHSINSRIRIAVGESDSRKLFFAILRLAQCTSEDFQLLSQMNGGFRSIRDLMIPLSLGNETRTMKRLQEMCMGMLDAYPTSYDEDVARLAGSAVEGEALPTSEQGQPDPVSVLYTNERHAVLQIRGEKEVLGHYLVLAEVAVDLLASGCNDKELEVVIRERLRGTVHDSIYHYCRGAITRLVREHCYNRTP